MSTTFVSCGVIIFNPETSIKINLDNLRKIGFNGTQLTEECGSSETVNPAIVTAFRETPIRGYATADLSILLSGISQNILITLVNNAPPRGIDSATIRIGNSTGSYQVNEIGDRLLYKLNIKFEGKTINVLIYILYGFANISKVQVSTNLATITNQITQ